MEYAYDKNGNLTKDLNKDISKIGYNLLNLPDEVTFANGNSIRYEYAADISHVTTLIYEMIIVWILFKRIPMSGNR